jgi:hypothetical protein
MEEAKASWNTVYQSKEGFECQITLRDDDETSVAERAKKVMNSLTKAGAEPIRRFKYTNSSNAKNNNEKANDNADYKNRDKTYFDEEGVRRCNRRLISGEVCSHPVTEREGKYGPFWSCPNFKDHVS